MSSLPGFQKTHSPSMRRRSRIPPPSADHPHRAARARADPALLFAEAREKFRKPFASALADDGLDKAVAALLRAPRPRDHADQLFSTRRGGASELIKPDQVILAVNALLRKCPVPCQ